MYAIRSYYGNRFQAIGEKGNGLSFVPCTGRGTFRFDAAFLAANSLAFVLLFCFVYGVWKPEKVKYVMRKLTDRLAPYIGKKTDSAVLHLVEQIDREIDHFHSYNFV